MTQHCCALRNAKALGQLHASSFSEDFAVSSPERRRLIVGISGASGTAYGVAALRMLSALDVETERILWDRLDVAWGDGDDSRPTVLAVSHRRVALQKADQVIVLDGGMIAALGPLDEVLATSVEMQRIWHGEEK